MALCRRGSRLIKSLPFLSRSLITSSSSYLSRSCDSSYRVRPVSLTEFTNRFPSTAIFGAASMSTESYVDDGCDYQHWLVVMEKPEGEPTREKIIDSYIKTLSKVLGSEEEARMQIYSVSTKCYFAFGAIVSEDVSYKIKNLPGVCWVFADSYLNIDNKEYGGEPFINGKAVPYHPKYHEQWICNQARVKR